MSSLWLNDSVYTNTLSHLFNIHPHTYYRFRGRRPVLVMKIWLLYWISIAHGMPKILAGKILDLFISSTRSGCCITARLNSFRQLLGKVDPRYPFILWSLDRRSWRASPIMILPACQSDWLLEYRRFERICSALSSSAASKSEDCWNSNWSLVSMLLIAISNSFRLLTIF